MQNWLQGPLVPFLLGAAAWSAAYYVRTQIALSRAPARPSIEDRLGGKIDALRDALNALAVTVGRLDERLISAERHWVA